MAKLKRAAHAIKLDGRSLMALRSDRTQQKYGHAGQFAAAFEGEQVRQADVPAVYSANALVAGMGYSRQMHQGEQAVPGYARGRNVCTRWPGWVMPAGEVTPATWPAPANGYAVVASAEYANMLWFLTNGPYIVGYPFGLGAPIVGSFSANYRGASLTLFDGRMWIGGFDASTGQPAPIWQYNGATWLQSTNALRAFLTTVYWQVNVDNVLQGHDTLVGSDTTHSYRFMAQGGNPLEDADWTASYEVGDPSYPITGVVAAPQHVYWLKTPNGVFDTDELGRSPKLTRRLDLATGAAYTGGASLINGRWLYYATGLGLARIDLTNEQRQDEIQACQPGAGAPNETEIQGPATALFPTPEGWTGAFLYNPLLNTSYLCYGMDRPQGVPGFGPMVWHGSEADIVGQVTYAGIAVPSTGPRLWLAATNGGVSQLYWQSYPRASTPLADYLNGGPMRFATDWSLDFPVEDWGGESVDKAPTILDNHQEGTGPDTTLTIWANPDRTGWISQGAVGGDRQILLPTGAAAGLLSVCQWRIAGTNPSAAPIRWRELRVAAQLNAHTFETRSYQVILGTNLGLRSGALDHSDQGQTLEFVQNLQRQGPVAFEDELKRAYTVTVRSGEPFQATADDADTTETWVIQVDLTIRTRVAYEGSALSDDLYVAS